MSKILLTILITLALLALTLAFFVAGIYGFGWKSGVVEKFIKIVPVPAAIVNGDFVRLSDFYQYGKLYESLVRNPAGETERRQILDKLVENKLIRQLVQKRGIVVTDQEIDRFYRPILRKVQTETKDVPANFEELVVKPELEKISLQISLLAADIDSKGYKKALRALAELKKGGDFAQTVKLYSEDEASKYINGEIGFVSADELPFWISDIIFDLELNEISEIVATPEGYRIFQVIARDDTVSPGRVQVRQVLIKGKDFEEYLQKVKENSRIFVFDKIW